MKARNHQAIIDDSLLATFTSLDYKVYNVAMRNINTIADMRVADLASLAGVSNASVVRFCKKCGYSGFPEFKLAIITKLQGAPETTQSIPSALESMKELVSSNAFDALEEQIDKAFELLRWTDGVLFLGSGRSSGLALYGVHLYGTLGFPSIPIISFPTYATSLGTEEVGSIVISQDGSSPAVFDAMKRLVTNGVHTVAITSDSNSPIGRLANVCISYERNMYQGNGSSTIAASMSVLYVIEELGRRLYNDMLENHSILVS